MWRLFRLLPVAIETLATVSAQGAEDADDAAWAAELLGKWSGDAGYNALVSAAVVADALVASQPALRLDDKAAADFALAGPAAAELLQTLRALLDEGGLFLEECDQTLTHAVLRAIRGKTVFVAAGTANASAVVLRWPAPGPTREEPREKAKEFLNCTYY